MFTRARPSSARATSRAPASIGLKPIEAHELEHRRFGLGVVAGHEAVALQAGDARLGLASGEGRVEGLDDLGALGVRLHLLGRRGAFEGEPRVVVAQRVGGVDDDLAREGVAELVDYGEQGAVGHGQHDDVGARYRVAGGGRRPCAGRVGGGAGVVGVRRAQRHAVARAYE